MLTPAVPGLAIRHAVPDDAALLRELAARTFYDAFIVNNTPENMEAYMSEAFTLRRVEAELADPFSTILVAEADGEPAGYAKLVEGEPPDCITTRPAIEIARFYLDRRFHGAGIAHQLMQACLDEVAEAGARTIYLGVWEHNPRAIAFYRKWRYEMCGSHPFPFGDEVQTDFWMQRPVHL